MPVYNEAAHLPATIEALVGAVGKSNFDADIVLVDDGSTDGSADIVRAALAGRLPLHVVRQPNSGRFVARRAGLEVATGEWVLLMDGRVRIHPYALNYMAQRLSGGERVWNAHVHVDSEGNPYGAFWDLLAKLAWRAYFDDPREISFGEEDFDRYPKGTTCFLAPRELLLDAAERFQTGYEDLRHANDDTPLIRWIAGQERIHLSPSFACDYAPRSTLGAFVRHSLHRGRVFLDGHGRRESRLFPAVCAFYPVSAALAVACVRRPALVPTLAAASCIAGVLAAGRGRSRFEAISFGVLLPLYAVLHGAGMWRGLALMARARVRPAVP